MTEPVGAGERLHRLLALLAHLARVGEAPIAELALRFDMSEEALVAELELAACCGLPPYTPDQLLELVLDDDTVRAYGLDALKRPPRLTADEGFAVAASARALLAVPGSSPDGPLASALAKLEAALGADRLQVEADLSPFALLLAGAARTHEVVEIDYLGAYRGGETTRAIEPHALESREGRLYLDAYCRLAAGWRRFQLDRITGARPLGAHFEPRPAPEELEHAHGAFVGGPGTELARIEVPDDRRVLFERFASGPIERDGSERAVVSVAVADRRFLGRLLLALGPKARLIEPASLEGSRAEVARAALERYRRRSSA